MRRRLLTVQTAEGPRETYIEAGLLGEPLSEVLRREGMPLNTRCGRRKLCQGCVVELVDGAVVHCDSGEVVVVEDSPKMLRACEFAVGGEGGGVVEIRVPERSVLAYEAQVVSEFRTCVSRAHDPIWCDEDAGIEQPIGVAIDVGTTTVVVVLVDLKTGEVVGSASGFNRQMHFGDDVLTRIHLCMGDGGQVKRLQEAVLEETVGPLIEQAMGEAGMGDENLVCITVGANTTMLHLWAGVDPSGMGMAPFTPKFLEHRVIGGSHLGLDDEKAEVHLLPGAGAFLGADVMAGVYASGMSYREATCLLVDIGTNGEIVLKHEGKLLGCSTAAGPAFEGAKLLCGVRAGRGAISHVTLEADGQAPRVDVIDDGKPNGLCGTAYIDFLAEGRRVGLLNATGRFVSGIADARLSKQEGHGLAYTVATGRGGEALMICEADIASLLQAKAAIAAGVLCLLERVGLKPGDVDHVFLAGGFGLHLDVGNALACGLLPGFEVDRVEAIGNSSLAGAYLALLDRGALREIGELGKRIEVVELNADPHFEECFIDQMSLP